MTTLQDARLRNPAKGAARPKAAASDPARELLAWRAAVEHLHSRGLPAPAPEFVAGEAWHARRLDVGRVSPETAVAGREALLAISDERDLWTRRLLDAERAAYLAGYADGHADEQRAADCTWAARPPSKVIDGLTLAQLEAQRWELRGEARTRETFGDPHPADYQGGPVNEDGRRAA